MGLGHSPRIVTDGLVLCLDAANQKSINLPTQADHGFADWYCFVNGTATYSIINSTGGIIYENNAGTITALVTATTPQRGTISVVAGRSYYGSVPINLVVENGHQCLAPLTMMGTQFWSVAVRSNPSTYYVYSPYSAATVNFYDNTAGGLTGTPTSTLSLSAGQSGTFTSNNLTNHWISSNVPIIATTSQSLDNDKTILSPMANYVYQRYVNYNGTTNFTTPTNILTNVVYDTNYKVMNMTIADGAGGDCAQGLGLEYLSDTYSWGNTLSDYGIAAPYADTQITTYYWSGTAWIAWDSHSLNGTITSPAYVRRDGTSGPGLDATFVGGSSTNMASGATFWKWEGTKPFYLAINDSLDDEFTVLGWLQSSVSKSPRSGNVWTDLSGNSNNGTLTNSPIFSNSNSGSFIFDGVNDFALMSSDSTFGNNTTWEAWVYCTGNVSTFNMFMGRHLPYFSFYEGNRLFFSNNIGGTQRSISTAANLSLNTWYHATFTTSYDGVNTTMKIYTNGVETATGTYAGAQGNYAFRFMIGDGNNSANNSWYPFAGRVSNVKIYNKTLSLSEILQNFNALRGRFGL